MSFMAIDIGSGLTKCSVDENMFYFESLVGTIKEIKDFSFNVANHHVIKVGDKQYLTGPAAKSYIQPEQLVVTAKATWCTDPNQLILLYSAIAKAYPNGYHGDMIVIAGLPMARFTQYQSVHKKLFIGTHKFSTPQHDYCVVIPEANIEVFPQAVGLHFSLVETQRDTDWNKGKTGLIDPGTHTLGYAVIDNGSYSHLNSANEKSAGASAGMMKLAKLMKNELSEQYDWHPNTAELLDALRIGYAEIFVGDKPVKILMKEIAQRYVPQVYGDVINEIVEKWDKGKATKCIISSGGGEYLIDYVRKYIPHAQLLQKTRTARDKINDMALFDVVRGYRIYGQRKYKSQLVEINNKSVATLVRQSDENNVKTG